MFDLKQRVLQLSLVLAVALALSRTLLTPPLLLPLNLASVNFIRTLLLNSKVLKVKQDLTFNVEFKRGKKKGGRGYRWEEGERGAPKNTSSQHVIFYFLAYLYSQASPLR